MYKVKIFDWSEGVLKVIESHWHSHNHAQAHAQAHAGMAKVYSPQGELVYANGLEANTYA